MTTIWTLPRIELMSLNNLQETRPVALLAGRKAWEAAGTLVNLPLVVQAEPHTVERTFLDSLAEGLPPQVEAVYGVGGGLVCDVAKYVGARRNLPVTLIPTALSVDGFFTSIVAVREAGTVGYTTTGAAERVIIDWDVISSAPANIRGAGIAEILSIVTGLLDWRYAAERNKNRPEERFQQWAASLAAGIAQQAFKIAKDVGDGKVDALRQLLDLICIEVQLTNQLGHTRPQEGSEQYFAYAIEPRVARGRGVPYADLVGPGILLSALLHGQDAAPLRGTLTSAGIRLGELSPNNIYDTLLKLPQYVKQHNLPYSVLHETDLTPEKARSLIEQSGLNIIGG
ncbi:MAG: iron-containing alcohol dehydrogenase [Armatimonadetes bacterium]|nr:iron-containing alcohol dehydrogenase [Anaerolineae bacterium]